jgi:hypothetical protein
VLFPGDYFDIPGVDLLTIDTSLHSAPELNPPFNQFHRNRQDALPLTQHVLIQSRLSFGSGSIANRSAIIYIADLASGTPPLIVPQAFLASICNYSVIVSARSNTSSVRQLR